MAARAALALPAVRTSAPRASATGDGGKHGHLGSLGNDRVHVLEIARVVGSDENVDVTAQCARLVAHAAADGRVSGRNGVDDGADCDGWGQVELDAGRATGVGPQRRGEAYDDRQGSTAGFTHSTGGRWRASSSHDSPASGDAKTSPVRVPT